MKYIKAKNEFENPFNVESEGFKYQVDPNQKVQPGDYGYLSTTYNDGKKGVIVKVLAERTYPSANIPILGEEEGDLDTYNNVWNVEVINKSEIGKNFHDGKVHFAKSYHLSHFNNRRKGKLLCGKIIFTTNPDIKL